MKYNLRRTYCLKICSVASEITSNKQTFQLISNIYIDFLLTKATAVVILVPPDAPMTNLALPPESTIMVGHIEDIACFPGSMKLADEGDRPK